MDRLDTIVVGAGGRGRRPRDSIDRWCRRCGLESMARDTVTRELAHEPLGCRPKVLKDTIRRHRCIDCRYVWRHTRRGDKYVTVAIDLTPILEGTGPVRRLDVVEGRSKKVFMSWLAERPRLGATPRRLSR